MRSRCEPGEPNRAQINRAGGVAIDAATAAWCAANAIVRSKKGLGVVEQWRTIAKFGHDGLESRPDGASVQFCGLKSMSRCAYFVSAPTVRFLQTMEELTRLPPAQRRKIAAEVYSEIKPLIDNRDTDELRRRVRVAQDERWRLISSGLREMSDLRFARVAIAEQWMLTQVEFLDPTSPVAEILAERRCGVIEDFVRDNLAFDSGEVIQLHPHLTTHPEEPTQSAA